MPLKSLRISTKEGERVLKNRKHSSLKKSDRRALQCRVANAKLRQFLESPYVWEPESLSNLSRAPAGATLFGLVHMNGTAFAAAPYSASNNPLSTIHFELVRGGVTHEDLARRLGLYSGDATGQVARNGDVAGFSVRKRAKHCEIDRARSYFNYQLSSKEEREMPKELVDRLSDELCQIDDDAVEQRKIESDAYDLMISSLPQELRLACMELFHLTQIAIWHPIATWPVGYEESLLQAMKKFSQARSAAVATGCTLSSEDVKALEETIDQYRLACNIVFKLPTTVASTSLPDEISKILEHHADPEFRKIFEYEPSSVSDSDLQRNYMILAKYARSNWNYNKDRDEVEIGAALNQIQAARYLLAGNLGTIAPISLYEDYESSLVKLPLNLANQCRLLLGLCQDAFDCKNLSVDADQLFLKAWGDYRLALSDVKSSGTVLSLENKEFLDSFKIQCRSALRRLLRPPMEDGPLPIGVSEKITRLVSYTCSYRIFELDDLPNLPEMRADLMSQLARLDSCPPELKDLLNPVVSCLINLVKKNIYAAIHILDGFPANFSVSFPVDGVESRIAKLPALLADEAAAMNRINQKILWSLQSDLSSTMAKEMMIARRAFQQAVKDYESSGQVLTEDHVDLILTMIDECAMACEHEFSLGYSQLFNDAKKFLPVSVFQLTYKNDPDFENLFGFEGTGSTTVKITRLVYELAILNSCPTDVWNNLPEIGKAAVQMIKNRIEAAILILSDTQGAYPSEGKSDSLIDRFNHLPQDLKDAFTKAYDLCSAKIWSSPDTLAIQNRDQVLELRAAVERAMGQAQQAGYDFSQADLRAIDIGKTLVQDLCAD